MAIFRRWMEQVRDLGLDRKCFILAGVGPVKLLRALAHMQREAPGMFVPDAVVRRLRGVPEDRVAAEGLALCSEIIAEVRTIPGVSGVHVMAFGWEDAIPEILERAGLSATHKDGVILRRNDEGSASPRSQHEAEPSTAAQG